MVTFRGVLPDGPEHAEKLLIRERFNGLIIYFVPGLDFDPIQNPLIASVS